MKRKVFLRLSTAVGKANVALLDFSKAIRKNKNKTRYRDLEYKHKKKRK